MPPRKGAKRKSESPPTVETSAPGKTYSTRSSNRKRVSYNESENEDEVNEPPPKILCSSSDDDFVVDDEEKYEQDCAKLPSVIATEVNNKKIAKKTIAHKKQVLKKNGKNSNPQAPINIAFKPVSYDESKIKSELNLSDNSDSEDSSDEGSCSPQNSSTDAACQATSSKLSKVLDNQMQQTDCSVKNETDVGTDCDGVNPWMKNLEALQNECNQFNQIQPPMKTEHTPKKGKKTKQVLKKGSKNTMMKTEPNEITVAEMLKLEKDQSSSSENDDDENWEKVKPTATCDDPEQERELPKSVEVTLDVSSLKRKKKGLDLHNIIRLKINRIRKEIQLVILFIDSFSGRN